MQVWFLIYLAIWSSAVVLYALVFYLLNAYEQPLRIIFVYLAALGMRLLDSRSLLSLILFPRSGDRLSCDLWQLWRA